MLYVTKNMCFFFFFQAEDGIRDRNVTGVQTCALPIYDQVLEREQVRLARAARGRNETCADQAADRAARQPEQPLDVVHAVLVHGPAASIISSRPSARRAPAAGRAWAPCVPQRRAPSRARASFSCRDSHATLP